jgi:hypothetical protein
MPLQRGSKVGTKPKRDKSGHMLVCGIGICDIHCKTEIQGKKDRWYVTWHSAICRCAPYEQERYPTYKGCMLDPRWHKASHFKRWFDKYYVEGYHLDKDILVPGNKIYGPDTCCFVPPEINSLFLSRKASRGKYPQGVSKSSDSRCLVVVMSKYGKQTFLGNFSFVSLDKAVQCYNEAKRDHWIDIATAYFTNGKITLKVKRALIRRAKAFQF